MKMRRNLAAGLATTLMLALNAGCPGPVDNDLEQQLNQALADAEAARADATAAEADAAAAQADAAAAQDDAQNQANAASAAQTALEAAQAAAEDAARLVARFVSDFDINNVFNPFAQPQDPLDAGAFQNAAGDLVGRNQTLRDGGVLQGSDRRDVLMGGLGQDTIFGHGGPDVMIGGTEHFATTRDANGNVVPAERSDRAFGGGGNDLFLWSPGDASDFYDGGDGVDALAFGLIGEIENNVTVFRVFDRNLFDPDFPEAGVVFFDPNDNLPRMDVTNSPGFCEIVAPSTSVQAANALEAIGMDHLARFVLRGARDAFDEAGAGGAVANFDDGIAVTLHLRNVEFVICASREGGEIEVIDLRTSPPSLTTLEAAAAEIPDLDKMIR